MTMQKRGRVELDAPPEEAAPPNAAAEADKFVGTPGLRIEVRPESMDAELDEKARAAEE